MDSIDEKMLLFVRQQGEIPAEARRIVDYDAVMHTATWVRRNVGLGTVCGYVIGFESSDRWWTWFFDRMEETAHPGAAETWNVESYSSEGVTWERRFRYWPQERRWERAADDADLHPELEPSALRPGVP